MHPDEISEDRLLELAALAESYSSHPIALSLRAAYGKEPDETRVSGVEEVESFDENTIIMTTVKGTLVVRGEDLHIEKLSLDGGDLRVEGVVDSLSYEDDSRERGGFFARLLR